MRVLASRVGSLPSRHGRTYQKRIVSATYRIRVIEVCHLRDRAELTRCATYLSTAAPDARADILHSFLHHHLAYKL